MATQEAYKPSGNFFYLGSGSLTRATQQVQAVTLKKDLIRGVKRLAEDAYCPYYGSTQASLGFFQALSQFIDIRAVKAELTYSQKKHYLLKVFTVGGYELVFKGVSGGYYGEGSRGCYDILKACGFNEKQCQNVFIKENFRISRRNV